MNRLITWLDLPAADLARAQVFYRALLGPSARVEARGGVVVIGPPDGPVEARLIHRPEGGAPGPLPYFRLRHPLETALARVEELGGRILELPHPIPPYGRRALIRDSEGNTIALYREAPDEGG